MEAFPDHPNLGDLCSPSISLTVLSKDNKLRGQDASMTQQSWTHESCGGGEQSLLSRSLGRSQVWGQSRAGAVQGRYVLSAMTFFLASGIRKDDPT